jgi:hypothetical protein
MPCDSTLWHELHFTFTKSALPGWSAANDGMLTAIVTRRPVNAVFQYMLETSAKLMSIYHARWSSKSLEEES